MSNPGTAERPWSTLAEVFTSGKASLLLGGDIVLLARGYHGSPIITGTRSSDVFIRALPGHTPLVQALTLDAAVHWDIGSLTITALATPAGHPDKAVTRRGVDISTQTAENCSYITLRNLSVYTAQDSSNRTAAQWTAASGGIAVFATNYSILGCHVYNGGGIQLGFHSTPGRVMDCVFENFCSDGSGLKCSGVLFANNCIYGSHKVNGNHNDLFQSWAAKNVVFKNNFLAAYVNPKQPWLWKTSPSISDCQGMGGYDGWKENWLIVGNVVKVDHPIGIWHLGTKGMTIVHNTVVRCGTTLAITSRPPCIHVDTSKSGAASSNVVVANNLCENYELNSGIVFNKSNAKIKVSTGFTDTFMNWAKNDLRLKPTATYAVGTGTVSVPGHVSDADMAGTPYVAPSTGKVDCGAYAVGTASASKPAWAMFPSQPAGRTVTAVTPVSGLGVDITWTAVAGDKCYVVEYGGQKIGTIRTGLTTYFWLNAAAQPASGYTVRAVSSVSYL